MAVKTHEHIEVRTPAISDLANIDALLGQYSPEHVKSVKESMIINLLDKDPRRTYAIAKQGYTVLGIMGVQPPSRLADMHSTIHRSLEIVNPFVQRGPEQHYIGKLLIDNLAEKAASTDVTELIAVAHNPQDELFWKEQLGDPVRVVNQGFGIVQPPIWRKPI